MSCEKLDELGLLSLEKAQKEKPEKERGKTGWSVCIHFMVFIEVDGASLFSGVHWNKRQWLQTEMQESPCEHLKTNKQCYFFFTVKLIRHQNKLPGEVEKSWPFEIIKALKHMTLSSLLWLTLLRAGGIEPDDHQRLLMNQWLCESLISSQDQFWTLLLQNIPV